MAEETGTHPPGVGAPPSPGAAVSADQLKYLLEHAPEVSFYRAVLFLERLWRESVPIGHEGPAASERVRLRPSVSMSFPPSDLESAEPIPQSDKVQITTTFLGLYGADSPLPTTYPERIAQIAMETRGERVRAFLDIFHHRILSLVYRSWRKYRPVSISPASIDPILDRALSVIGFSSKLGLGGSVPRLSEVRLLALRSRSAAGLEFLVRKRLGYLADLVQIIPRTVAIPKQQRSRLGQRGSVLGESLVAGAKVADRNKVRVAVHAKDFDTYLCLLPGERDWHRIEGAFKDYLRAPIDHDFEVKLDPEDVPAWELGSRKVPARLGLTAWLGRPREVVVRRWNPVTRAQKDSATAAKP
jgi:type VI secretion system protein ImpH